MRQTSPSPLMITLNASKRDVCQVKIERTDSPLQGLVMLNSPQFVEAARTLANSFVKRHGEKDVAIVDEAFRRLTSRFPDMEERAVLLGLLAEQTAHFAERAEEATALLSIGESAPCDTDQAARVAAVATLVSVLMNYDECISKR